MDVSTITDSLYIAAQPGSADIPAVQELGVGLIINMVFHLRRPKVLQESEVPVLWLPTFDFPLLPIPVETLHRGVEAALPVIERGEKVMVYCQRGRHRSVAMASAILIAQGYSADEAMALILERRPIADPHARHIERQIRRYEAFWLAHRQKHDIAAREKGEATGA